MELTSVSYREGEKAKDQKSINPFAESKFHEKRSPQKH